MRFDFDLSFSPPAKEEAKETGKPKVKGIPCQLSHLVQLFHLFLAKSVGGNIRMNDGFVFNTVLLH